MKEFIVKSNGKQFKVKANDFRSAIEAIKIVTAKDEASQLDVIQALVTDEQAAIAAYANAIKNLDGKVDPQYIEVLRNILKEENKHVENLQAIITGNVTEKNVEDSMKDVETYRGFSIYKVGGDWEVKDADGSTWNYDGSLSLAQVKKLLDKGLDRGIWDSMKDSFYAIRTRNNGRVGEWYVKADSEQKAFDIVKRQPGHQFDEFVSITQVNENELKRVGARIIS